MRTTAVLIVLCACAAPEDTQRTSAAIVGGTLDTTDSAVVALAIQTGQGSNVCSGVVVSPHVVVTAAHCVNDGNATFQVLLGTDYASSTGTIAVTEVHFDAAYDGNNPQNGHDIGVAITSAAIPVTPIAMSTTALSSADDGRPIRFVGFGQTTPTMFNSKRRMVTSSVTSFDASTITVTDTAHNACIGDSGGAALMQFNNVEVLAGVISFFDPQCQTSVSTRVDAELAFVEPFVNPSTDAGATDSGVAEAGNDAAPAADASPAVDASSNDAGTTQNGGGGCGVTPETRGSTAWAFLPLAFAIGRRRSKRARR